MPRQVVIDMAQVGLPKLWSAEEPAVYHLVLTLVDAHGDFIETEPHAVGFRHVEVTRRALLVNKQPVMIKGVNRWAASWNTHFAGGHPNVRLAAVRLANMGS